MFLVFVLLLCGFLSLNQDPREYFDSQQVNAVKTLDDSQAGMDQMRCNLSSEEAFGSLRASISKIKTMGLNDPLITPEIALRVMTSLCLLILKNKLYIIDKCLCLYSEMLNIILGEHLFFFVLPSVFPINLSFFC